MSCPGESKVGKSAVALVIGGGYRTFDAAHKAIEADIPLLVFEGSGNAANLIVAAYDRREQT